MLIDQMQTGSVHDRILLLRSVDTLSDLDLESYTLLAEHARQRHFRAGETIMTEGVETPHIYMVLAGRVKVTREGNLVATVERGRSVGLLSFLARDPVGVTGVALEDTTTLEIPREALNEAYDKSFAMTRRSIRFTAAALVRARGSLPKVPDGKPADPGVYPERPKTTVERLIALRQAPLFRGCNVDAVAELVRQAVVVEGQPGDVLWRIGDPSTFWLRMDYGVIECKNQSGDRVEIGANFVLGITDAFAAQPRTYEARALTRYTGTRQELESVLTVLESHPDVGRGLLAINASLLLRGN